MTRYTPDTHEPLIPENPQLDSFDEVTRSSVTPTYLKDRSKQTKQSIELQTDWYIPAVAQTPMEANSRADIIANNPIPEARPSITGLRKAMTELRIKRAERQIDKYQQRGEVLKYVGEMLVKGNGFRPLSNPENTSKRPQTFIEDRHAKKLNTAWRKSGLRRTRAANLASNYPSPNPRISSPDFLAHRQHRLFRENRGSAKLGRLHDRLIRQAERRERKARKIIAKPHLKVQKAIERRKKLIVKSESIRRAG